MSDQIESSGIICEICQQPIERRRELVVRGVWYLKLTPRHYQCHADDVLNSSGDWKLIELYSMNSAIGRIFISLMFLGTVVSTIIVGLEGQSSVAVLFISFSLSVLIAMFPTLVAYFKFERKVPK